MEKIIGVVAGAGPFAGLDLLGKILDQTLAGKDQDHLTVFSLSQPNKILDRTEFLLGRVGANPAFAIVEQLLKLERMGAAVAGIPCNTAHAPAIFDVILQELETADSNIHFLHMIAETAGHIRQNHPRIKRVGVLSTTGTFRTRIYPDMLEPEGFTVVLPDEVLQERVIHPAIYDPVYGIKANGRGTETAVSNLQQAVRHLQEKGAEAIILGCTEIPLAIRAKRIGDTVIIDPTFVLARALIREANPAKLKPLV